MKFTKHTFLMLGLASVFSIAWIGDGMAKRWDCTSKPSAGQYCKNSGDHQICPFGCYCPGGEKRALGDDYNANSFCSDSSKGNQWPYQDSGIYHCPSSHPKSLGSQSNISGCYYEAQNNDGTIKVYYNEEKDIEGGYYLPSNTWNPVKKCKDGYYCPGGKFVASRTDDVGLKKCASGKIPNAAKTGCESCPDGKVPNSEQTACENPPIECAIGTYLPENGTSESDCTKCPDGYYCPGGEYPTRVFDQGYYRCPNEEGKGDIPNSQRTDCVSCPTGKEPDENHATCVDKKTFVAPGYYFKENSIEPVPCTGTKKFCPGGRFYKKSVEQGRYDCPFNSNANSTHTGCSVKLTQAQMRNGVSGKGNCWKITDPEDYKYCIYGVRFLENEELDDEGGAQGTTDQDKQWCIENGYNWGPHGCTQPANPKASEDTEDVYYKKTSGDLFDLSPSSFTKVNGRPDDLCNGGYWSYSEEHGFIQVKCMPRR